MSVLAIASSAVRSLDAGRSETSAQVGQVGGYAFRGCFQNQWRVGDAGDLDEDVGIDVTRLQIRVAVAARVELVARVVQVNQVDTAGDGTHALDQSDEVFAAAHAWQVSRQNPACSKSPTASHSRSMASRVLAMA